MVRLGGTDERIVIQYDFHHLLVWNHWYLKQNKINFHTQAAAADAHSLVCRKIAAIPCSYYPNVSSGEEVALCAPYS
jgi:hypothetical protein